ncbi:hypothetical protein CF327_g6703 [Tilletia walkeri]|nr:hypothetical protein CF327_g6703 [Tilletia walkeri]
MATKQLSPGDLARALRTILSLSSSSSQAIDLPSIYSGLASLAATNNDSQDSTAFWTELSLLAPPSSQTLSQTGQGRRPPTAVGATIRMDMDTLSARTVPLEMDWNFASASGGESTDTPEATRPVLPPRNGTMRYWPATSSLEDVPSTEKKTPTGEAIHFVYQWHSYSLFVPPTTCTAIARQISKDGGRHSTSTIAQALIKAILEAQDRCEGAGIDTGNWPSSHVIAAFAMRFNSVVVERYDSLENSPSSGLVLSSTAVLPFSIGTRSWDSDVPSLPSDVATFSTSSPALGGKLQRGTGQESTARGGAGRQRNGLNAIDRNVDCNADRNVDCNSDVNNDGAATGPNSSTNARKAVSGNADVGSTGSDPTTSDTTINPNPTSTSTSNAGTGVAVAVGLQSAAAAMATHGPTFSVVQGCNSDGTTQTGSDTPTSSKTNNNSGNTLNIGFGISFKLPTSRSRQHRERERERDRAFALQLAAARNAVSSGAVVVAVPGSSASASTSAAAGENATVQAEADSAVASPAGEGEQSKNKTVQARAGPPTTKASDSKRLHSGNGQVSQSFLDWVPEGEEPPPQGGINNDEDLASSKGAHPKTESETKTITTFQPSTNGRGGTTTKTTVTTTTTTTIDRFPSSSPEIEPVAQAE